MRLSSPLRAGALVLGGALAVAAISPTFTTAQTPPQLAAPTASPAAASPAGEAVVARVDGIPITEGDLAVAADDPALQLPGVGDAQKRDLLVGYMVDLKLGARAAEAAKVGDGRDFSRRLAYFRDKLLLDDYLEGQVRTAVTPEAARKLYDDTVKNLKPEDEVRARHILVEGEDEAKAAAERVRKGEDFAKIAGEVSKDPGSKTDGGDLGFFAKERMVPAFAEAAFKLQPGQVSEPVKSQFGWHVIKLEEKRTKPVPAFDEMKEQVETYLARKAQQDIILSLREKAKIERLDQPPTSAPPAGEPKKP